MNKLLIYLENRKSRLVSKKDKCNNEINKLKYECDEINNKISEITKSIDTTFELFSPNVMTQDYASSEINVLKEKQVELYEKISRLSNIYQDVNNELIEINQIINSEYENNNRIAEIKDNYIKMKHKYIQAYDQVFIGQNKITEMYLEKQSYKIKENIIKNIDDSLYKEQLCEKFIDLDLKRSKMELYDLSNNLKLIKKNADKMFHVKHFSDYEEYNKNLKSTLFNQIEYYKEIYKIIIDFAYIGKDIWMDNFYTEYLIKIVNELVENSFLHSNCNSISITANITEQFNKIEQLDSIDNEKQNNNSNNIIIKNNNEINEIETNSINNNVRINANEKNYINNNLITNNELTNQDLKNKNLDYNSLDYKIKTIDFNLNNKNKYKITITVSDSGNGFTMRKKYEDHCFGFKIIDEISKIINAQLSIDSTLGLGTNCVVEINYKK